MRAKKLFIKLIQHLIWSQLVIIFYNPTFFYAIINK